MTFTHLDETTPEDAWAEAGVAERPVRAGHPAGRARRRPPRPPQRRGPRLSGTAHPPRCGGARRRCRFCARPGRTPTRSPRRTPQRLREIRLAEFDSALTGLGGSITARFLDLGDGGLPARYEEIRRGGRRRLRPARPGDDRRSVQP
ncbi:hypothetical protein IOD13_19245 [Brevibacterium casei]|nr:hypothetical protein [Brevibacterium casei]